MPSTGSIIQLHHHNNFELLEFLTEDNGNLYYKSKPVYTPISLAEHNVVQAKEDGLFVDGTNLPDAVQYNLLTRFSYINGNLCFDSVIVSREYQRASIQLMITQLWEAINTGGTV